MFDATELSSSDQRKNHGLVIEEGKCVGGEGRITENNNNNNNKEKPKGNKAFKKINPLR